MPMVKNERAEIVQSLLSVFERYIRAVSYLKLRFHSTHSTRPQTMTNSRLRAASDMEAHVAVELQQEEEEACTSVCFDTIV